MSPARWHWGEPLDPVRGAFESGRVLAIPTESSYALAVDPTHPRAVEAVFRLKSRRRDAPLGVVVADPEQAEALGGGLVDPRLRRLATLWPAPLSLLLPLSREIPAAAGSSRLAVRVPAHRGLRQLLSALGGGLTATSANRSGEEPILSPDRVADLLADEPGALIVDDGTLPGGNPSTLVGVGDHGIEIVRPGAVSTETLAALFDSDPEGVFSAASVEILADESR